MSKKRVAIGRTSGVVALVGRHAAPIEVVDVKPGNVTWLDRAKRYYKEAIAAVGVLTLALQQLTPLFDSEFSGTDAQRWFTIAVSAVTILGTVLKDNEHWIEA